MNRKEGIDYFPVKCTTDNALNLVMYECGLKSHAVIYSLLKEIYGGHCFPPDGSEGTGSGTVCHGRTLQ